MDVGNLFPQPLRVRAYLRAPIVCDEAMPLDGVLLYQAMRRAYGPADASLPGALLDTPLVPLPLAVAGEGTPNWYYHCSWAQWPPDVAYGKTYWEKRVSTMRAAEIAELPRSGKVEVAKGRYRLYHMPLFYKSALYLEWYVNGDKDAIADLLTDVWGIGKKQSQGFGRVMRWEIEPQAEDWSVTRDGKLMRAVPISGKWFDPARARHIGYRPPYWLPENQTLCNLPPTR